MNFGAKQDKRSGRVFTTFKNYRLWVLLYARGVTWPVTLQAPKLSRTRPHSGAVYQTLFSGPPC